MKQNTGWMAAIGVAVAAIFGFSVLPSRNSAPPASTEGTQQKAAAAQEGVSPNLAVLKSPCREIEKRIREFLPDKEFPPEKNLTSEKKVFAPEECYDKPGPRDEWTSADKKASDLQFLIATLPNPIHTHFAQEFDRLTDALQQAAQDQGYNYDSSWLPWVNGPRQYSGLTDQDNWDARRSFREKQPGVLVFRSALPDCSQQGANQTAQDNCVGRPYQQGLLVFVVGENPTGGIDSEQFENAIAWIEKLRPQGTGDNLRILSPFFSGSFPSLAQLLSAGAANAYILKNKATIPPTGGRNNLSSVEVFSGSAASQAGIDWFQQFLKDKGLGSFRTFQESDDLVLNRYCRLLERQGYDTGRLAIVSEDETAYGAIGANARVIVSKQNNSQQNDPDQDNPDPALYQCVQYRHGETHGPLNLYYPRDIASLRSAYAKQGVFGTAIPSQQSAPTGLPQSLSEDDSTEHDTIRSYGGEQSPLSQEATLFALVNLLKAHRIEFILLRSSNALDQIFLTEFFARTYPDGRVVILNSDVMFRRNTESQGFRGTMTLNTYPLLSWEQDWAFYHLPESRHSHRAFPDGNSEGLYLAGRFLIHLQDSELGLAAPQNEPLCLGPGNSPSSTPCGQQGSSVLLQYYGPPSWLLNDPPQPTRPPTWLSVLASGEVWPVAVIDEDTVPEKPNRPELQAEGPGFSPSSLPVGTYYVKTAYFAPPLPPTKPELHRDDESARALKAAKPRELGVSVESFIRIPPGKALTVKAPKEHPTWAAGYEVYIGEQPGKEKLEYIANGWSDYSLRTRPGGSGSSLPTDNTSDRSVLAPAYTRAIRHSRDMLLLPLSIGVWFSLAFAWCLWHLYCCWTGSQTGSPRSRAYFAPVPGPQHNILIFFGCTLFALLAIVMAMLTGSFYPDQSRFPFLHQLLVIVTATLKGTSPTDVWPSPFSHQWRMTVLYWLLLLLPLVAMVANYLKTAHPRRAKMRCGEKKAEEVYLKAKTDEETFGKKEEVETKQAPGSNDSSSAAYRKAPETPESDSQSGRRIDSWTRKIHSWTRTIRCWFVKKTHHYFVKWRGWLRQHPRRLAFFAGLFYVAATIVLAAVFYHVLVLPSKEPTRVFVFWRSVNLFTGVSPLLPFLLLILGMYAWFWYTLSGIALFNRDRPLLPSSEDMDPRLSMFTQERAGKKIERLAKPLSGGYGVLLPGLLIGLLVMFLFFTWSEDFAIRSLGPKSYGQLFFIWLSVCIALIVTDAFQLLRIWARLHQLLVYLDRLPLRRTLYGLKGFSWGSVWQMSGSVLDQRYKLLSRQMESFRHLKNELERLAKVAVVAEGQPAPAAVQEDPDGAPTLKSCNKRLATCEASGLAFATWYVNCYHDPHVTDVAPMGRHQEELAKTAATVCTEILMPEWGKERNSLIQDPSHPNTKEPDTGKLELSSAPIPTYQTLAEEFFILPYLGFVQNILGRMRTLGIGMLWLFIAATISVASYPFDPRPLLSGIFLFVFIVVATIMIFVYAQMHRDTTLSHITNTNPGELGLDFWIKLVTVGIGPSLALLTALFPEMAGFLASWLQPSSQAIK